MSKKRLLILITPLLITPIMGYLLAEGYLNFGAGEKDLLILLPWFLWSITFIGTGSLLWQKNVSHKIWLFKSIMYSILVMLILWISLLIYSMAVIK